MQRIQVFRDYWQSTINAMNKPLPLWELNSAGETLSGPRVLQWVSLSGESV